MKPGALNLLGLAFASADLLLEVDGAGRVALALGAASRLCERSETELVGADWLELFAEPERELVTAMGEALGAGGRRGPTTVRLADGRRAQLSMTRMPQLAPATSVALSLGGPPLAGLPQPKGEDGLHDAAGLDAVASALLRSDAGKSGGVDVALVDIAGVENLAAHAMNTVAAALRAESYAGAGAARLGDGRFAVLRQRGDPTDAIADRLTAAGARIGVVLDAQVAEPVPLDAAQPVESALRALRFVVDDFLRDGLAGDPGRFAAAFEQRAAQTASRAEAFLRMVENRAFTLAFQPIVSLRTGAPHHFEVLARFEAEGSPYETIRMAEELDIIPRFDLAMTQAAIDKLRGRATSLLKLAVNLSGRSLMSDIFVEQLMKLLRNAPDLVKRLMFEVTESAELSDICGAERRIQTLRGRGHQVWLDDFGAGAANFAYLRGLTVDGVKIDGQYVKEMTVSNRDAALVRHIAALCRDLNIATVAEMVETPEVEAALRAAGVDHAQGWLYGKPLSEPVVTNTEPVRPTRRVGAVESWR